MVVEDSYNSEDECDKAKSQKPFEEESSERIWNEDEEIAILKIAIKFWHEREVDPATQERDFFVFLQETQQLIGEFSKDEVTTKLRLMKEEYESNLIKGKSCRHANKILEYCENIWGGENNVEEILLINKKYIGLGENIVKEAMKYIEESKRIELMQQWKQVQALEFEILKKRAALVEYQTKLMLEEANKRMKKTLAPSST
ncbi:uncharacterized protein LOC123224043 [Mangifera indica]|uniref:uncharacterized protein LOC123224036 n=1 Tax=Mangifera indica TaxID=29780 RepID=UPI001CFB5926|nr:uncharacterized protein LOC123224036 [Mangifera indica]XP_044503455.1 uncharacterized protein LOC123224043 [Mangifera indica]